MDNPSFVTSGESKAEQVHEMDQLATRLILEQGYKGSGNAEGLKRTRDAARTVLAATAALA